jgi:hypothetical protein
MAEKKAAGRKPAAKKKAPARKKKGEGKPQHVDHLHVKSITVHDHDHPGHSIHMRAGESGAGVWVCGPKHGECLALVSAGGQQPYVCIYGGPMGYDAPPVAIQVSREDGDVLIQTVDPKGNPQFIRLSDVINASNAQGFQAAVAPKGFDPVAFMPPPHEESPQKKDETQPVQKTAEEDESSAPAVKHAAEDTPEGDGGQQEDNGQKDGEETP